MRDIVPSRNDLQTYFYVVSGYLDGLIPLRSFAEKGAGNGKPPRNIWIKADDEVASQALEFAALANQRGAAFYVIPGVVDKPDQASSSDITQMQTLLIDIDEGNTEKKLALLESALGQATLIVESGGVTREGHAKLHIYWQLSKAVSGNDLQKLLELRHQIALAFGGDTHFKSAHQPIRVAGSVYHKGGAPKLVKIRSYNPIEYDLRELIEPGSYLPTLNNNNDTQASPKSSSGTALSFDQLLTHKVYEGASGEQTRFNHLSRVTGYWLRRCHEGLISEEEAIEEIHSYNLSNVIPPWPVEKIRQTVKGLWKLHLQKYGEPKKVVPDKSNNLTAIIPTEWQGSPPEREWVLQDWLPRGYVTALYGDGGVGKSLFAQQLMTCVAGGRDFIGIKAKPCRVYALMCEDDKDELWRRQASINEYYGLNMDDLANIRLVSRVGDNNLLMVFNNSDVGQLTEFFNQLRDDILSHQPDLIILDTAADLFGGNENNRPQVRQFIQTACGSLARDTGGAVLLCAHPSEGGIQKGTGTGGSTAWNNTVRSRWYLKRPEGSQFNANHRVLARVKSNYATIGGEEYLEWKTGVFIHLNPLDFSPRKAGQTQAERNDAERDRKTEMIIKIIEAEALADRFYTARQFAETFEGKYGLGGKRTIQDRVSVTASQGKIGFFFEPDTYGLDMAKSAYGYLCTENTEIKVNTEIKDTGKVLTRLIKVIPMHSRCILKLGANRE